MCRMRGLIAAVAVFAVLGAAPSHAAVEVGLSDQHPESLEDPLARWLGFRTARIIVPWDVAWSPAGDLDAWLAAARGMDVVVSFEHRREEDCRERPCVLPTPPQMAAAFAAFRARWPRVSAFGAWNEGNHPSQPTADRPEAAAALYQAMAEQCPGCRIVAAEVVSMGGMTTWLRRFLAALPAAPQLWGLHNYGDASRGLAGGTDALLSTVPGQVWVTETGGVVRHVAADGTVSWPYDEARARAAVVNAFALADARSDRISRLYLYQWRAGADERWDSGLLRPDGSPRPSFTAVAARLRPGAGLPARLAAAPLAPAWRPKRLTALRLVRRPMLGLDYVVRARVACPSTSPRPCAARMALRLPGRRHVVASAARRAAPGATVTLRARLPARTRRAIRHGAVTKLLADVGAGATWRRGLAVPWRR